MDAPPESRTAENVTTNAMDEEAEILSGLMDVIETLLLRIMVQRGLLEALAPQARQETAETLEALHAPQHHAQIAQLRSAILRDPPQASPPKNWREISRQLIESARNSNSEN